MDDINIDHSVTYYINLYGVNASVKAAQTADILLAHGDMEGFKLWMRIGRAIEEMQATTGRTTY